MFASSRVVHPGWLATGSDGGTEAEDTIEMNVESKTNRSSHYCATGCAVCLVDLLRFHQQSSAMKCQSRAYRF
jgi:hypothetical protein